MQKRINIQASTYIIILSMLTIIIQFGTYYFFDADIVIWAAASLTCMICCQLLLEHTSTYIACFNYSLLTLFISGIILVLAYFGEVHAFLPYTHSMLIIAFINWLVPTLLCFVRYMLDVGAKIEDFYEFYRNNNILFLLVYLFVFIYGSFSTNAFPWAYNSGAINANFIPFNIISLKVEDYIYGTIPLNNIILYLSCRIISYIPFGFYISLILRNYSRYARGIVLITIPLLLEALQYFIIPEHCDIDDFFYAVIGGLLGGFAYFLTNVTFRLFSGKDLFAKEHGSRYMGGSLHF